MKQFVMMYVNTIKVRMQAIRSASASELPAFSPRALAQSLQNCFIVKKPPKTGGSETDKYQLANINDQICS